MSFQEWILLGILVGVIILFLYVTFVEKMD